MFHIFEIRAVKMPDTKFKYIAKGQCSTCGVLAVLYMTDQEYHSLYKFIPRTVFKNLPSYCPKCPACEKK